MAGFDPDKWLEQNPVVTEEPTEEPAFDPDAWLASTAEPAKAPTAIPSPAPIEPEFDPDAWLASTEPPEPTPSPERTRLEARISKGAGIVPPAQSVEAATISAPTPAPAAIPEERTPTGGGAPVASYLGGMALGAPKELARAITRTTDVGEVDIARQHELDAARSRAIRIKRQKGEDSPEYQIAADQHRILQERKDLLIQEKQLEARGEGTMGGVMRPFAQLGTQFLVKPLRGAAQTALIGPKAYSWALKKRFGEKAPALVDAVTGFIDNVTAKVDKPTRIEGELSASYQERLHSALNKGDWGTATYQIATEGGLDMAVGLLQVMMLGSFIKGSKPNANLKMLVPGLEKAGTKAILGNASIRSLYSFITQPGTVGEKIKSALTTMAFMSTPAIARLVPVLPGIADLGLNTVISTITGAYPDAWKAAQEEARTANNPDAAIPLFVARALPTFIADVLGSSGTTFRGTKGNKIAQNAIKDLPDTKPIIKAQNPALRAVEMRSPTGETAAEVIARAQALEQREGILRRAGEIGGALGRGEAVELRPQPFRAPAEPARGEAISAERVIERAKELGPELGKIAEARPPLKVKPTEPVEVAPSRPPAPKSVAELREMTLSDLRAEADARDLSHKGVKGALIKRIVASQGKAAEPVRETGRISPREVEPTRPSTLRIVDIERAVVTEVDALINRQRGADIAKEGAGVKKGGYVDIPTTSRLETVGRAIGGWFKRKFTPTRGLGKELYEIQHEWKMEKSASEIDGMVAKANFTVAKKTLGKRVGKDVANEGLRQVLYGEKTPVEFARKFKLDAKDPIVKMLDKYNEDRSVRAQELAGRMKKVGASDELVQKILEDEAYVSRFYEKHILGKEYTPNPDDYRNAVKEVESELDLAIDRFAQKATRAGRETGVDVARYLETGDVSAVKGMSPKNAEKVLALGRDSSRLRQMISESYMDGENLMVVKNSEAIRDAATSIVDFHLGKTTRAPGEGGSIDISNLRRRVLAPVFRKLYGEITDPVFASGRTATVQNKLLANLTFFERIFHEGENRWWTPLASNKAGTIKQLGNVNNASDRYKYGNLAGKWVKPEFAALLKGEKALPVIQQYYQVKSAMRLLKLYGPRTIVRNYVTALTGFTLGSGDMFERGYAGNLRKAHALLKNIIAKKPEALQTLRDLAKQDVFREQGNSMVDDIERVLSTNAKGFVTDKLRLAGRMYSYIDFPTKVASYWTRLKLGDTPKEAAEHVRKFYQHPESVPEFVRDLSKLPLSDYPGYFFDSMRITGNQIAHAIKSTRTGNVKPLIGFLMSRSLHIASLAGQGALLARAWAVVNRKLRREDDEIVSSDVTSKQQELAVREFLPDYYRDAPLWVWNEKRKDGTSELFYTVTGNQTAFPAEDLLLGAMQSSGGTPKGFTRSLARGVKEARLEPGMLESTIYKTATGDELNGTFKSRGITDLGKEDPDKAKIWAESLGWGVAEVLGGQFTGKGRQIYAAHQKEKAGQVPKAGTYTARTSTKDAWLSMIQLVRTYRVNEGEMQRMVKNRLSDFGEPLRNSKKAISREQRVRQQAGASTTAQQRGAMKAQRDRLNMLHQMEGIAKNAQSIDSKWFSDKKMLAILRESSTGLSRNEAQAVLDGKVSELSEYDPQERFTQMQRLYGEGGTARSRTRSARRAR